MLYSESSPEKITILLLQEDGFICVLYNIQRHGALPANMCLSKTFPTSPIVWVSRLGGGTCHTNKDRIKLLFHLLFSSMISTSYRCDYLPNHRYLWCMELGRWLFERWRLRVLLLRPQVSHPLLLSVPPKKTLIINDFKKFQSCLQYLTLLIVPENNFNPIYQTYYLLLVCLVEF